MQNRATQRCYPGSTITCSQNIFLLFLKYKIWVVEVVEPPKTALREAVKVMDIVPVVVAIG